MSSSVSLVERTSRRSETSSLSLSNSSLRISLSCFFRLIVRKHWKCVSGASGEYLLVLFQVLGSLAKRRLLLRDDEVLEHALLLGELFLRG